MSPKELCNLYKRLILRNKPGFRTAKGKKYTKEGSKFYAAAGRFEKRVANGDADALKLLKSKFTRIQKLYAESVDGKKSSVDEDVKFFLNNDAKKVEQLDWTISW